MTINYKRWQGLFVFGMGLALGTAFCMKWMESDLWSNGQLFTILGLELFYPPAKLEGILSGLDEKVKTILRYHLVFDFAFMAGIYPCISSLCMMGREKIRAGGLKNLLLVLASAQMLAWILDSIENYFLFKWIHNPGLIDNPGLFHSLVIIKWILALSGVLVGLTVCILKRRKPVPG